MVQVIRKALVCFLKNGLNVFVNFRAYFLDQERLDVLKLSGAIEMDSDSQQQLPKA